MIQSEGKCEWAVSSSGNILIATERFCTDLTHKAVYDGAHITFHYDWFRCVSVKVPDPIKQYLALQSTVLLVVFNSNGEVLESVVPLEVSIK